jgi:hypothetical protein
MPTNGLEVFDKLISEGDTEVYLDFIAYAIFAHQKGEWMKLYESNHGDQAPAKNEIDQWIENITDYQFEQMKEEAARFFDAAARDYLKDEIERGKTEAINNSILSEVKTYSSPWRHLGIALLMAVLARLIQLAQMT